MNETPGIMRCKTFGQMTMLKPLLHRILVKPDDVEEVSAGGIVLAIDPKKERLAVECGTIVRIGDTAFTGEFKTNSPPRIGERVYYAKYSGKTVKDIDKQEYVILNDEDIVCTIEERNQNA